MWWCLLVLLVPNLSRAVDNYIYISTPNQLSLLCNTEKPILVLPNNSNIRHLFERLVKKVFCNIVLPISIHVDKYNFLLFGIALECFETNPFFP